MFLIMLTLVLFTSCSNDNKQTLTDGKEALGLVKNKDENSIVDIKEANLSIVLNIDTENKKIIIYELENQEKVVLLYSGSTNVIDEYEKEMTMPELEIGEIVETEYKKGTQKLTKIKVSKDVWEYTNITGLKIQPDESIIKVGKTTYNYNNDIKVFSNKFSIDLIEINNVDELTIRGVNNTIYSIEVTKGHGYIKLANADYFEGGIIEIGSKNINMITKDMVIVAKEGDFVLTATKDGVGGSQNITVARNEEILVDISNFQEQAVRMGSFNFTISPNESTLYIDGTKTGYSDLVSLTYGTHTIKVILDGYTSYTEKIIVNSIYDSKEISLISEDSEEEETTSATTYKVSVNTPEEAVVYFDGVYKGISPVSFTKEEGTHTIVLSKTGYENKSYTVFITSNLEDVELSFPELTEITE